MDPDKFQLPEGIRSPVKGSASALKLAAQIVSIARRHPLTSEELVQGCILVWHRRFQLPEGIRSPVKQAEAETIVEADATFQLPEGIRSPVKESVTFLKHTMLQVSIARRHPLTSEGRRVEDEDSRIVKFQLPEGIRSPVKRKRS